MKIVLKSVATNVRFHITAEVYLHT